MLFNKRLKKKGFMIIPVIIIGTIIITLSSYIFQQKMLNLKYEDNNNNYMLREKTDEKYREILLTKLATYLKSNNKDKLESIDITFENSYIKYDTNKKYFILNIPYKEREFKEEYYTLENNGGKDSFKYVKTIIVER
ncbi:MAG: hypothetical protein KID00_05030 [Clostridium argentinense]|uniref:hypothetical protein n=1 Tax=Clostridium butanoliproducens TaxID=2991837 RepID=UPI001D9812B9|nr:hypothetical protein [Clostridium butanoliproducens]MBS5823214.1 hypothetical protein [Clostridium argentinense]MDU1349008.1 hypothetical protein [Clostridium argentinense]